MASRRKSSSSKRHSKSNGASTSTAAPTTAPPPPRSRDSLVLLMQERAKLDEAIRKKKLDRARQLGQQAEQQVSGDSATAKFAEEYKKAGKMRIHGDATKERAVVHDGVVKVYGLVQTGRGGKAAPIGILTTAPIETFAAVAALQQGKFVDEGDGWKWYVGELGGVEVVVGKSSQGSVGGMSATTTTAKLIDDWGVKAVFAVGIAWGADRAHQSLGDVLIASIIQPYDHVRVSNGIRELSQPEYVVSKALLGALEAAGVAFKGPGGTKALTGAIVSSSMLIDDEMTALETVETVEAKLKGSAPVIGGEMEMAGVITVCQAAGVPCAVVKAVCDFAGVGEGKDKVAQPLAARNAVLLVSKALSHNGGKWVHDLPIPTGQGLRLIDQKAFVAGKSASFVGRVSLSRSVGEWVSGSKRAPADQSMLVTASPGAGKTAWASALVSGVAPGVKVPVIASHFCRFDVRDTVEARRVLGSVAKQILTYASEKGISVKPGAAQGLLSAGTSPSAGFGRFLRSLDTKGPNGVVLIDSLDESLDTGGPELIQALLEGLTVAPSWIQFLFTSRGEKKILDLLAKVRTVDLVSDEQENLTDIRAWVVSVLGTSKAVEAVVKASQGNFLYAQQLVGNSTKAELEASIAGGKLPKGLGGVYRARAEAAWSGSVVKEVLPILNVLSVALAPVPPRELKLAARAAGLAEDIEVVDVIRGVLSSVTVEDPVDGSVRIYHKSFTDWLVAEGWRLGPLRRARADVKRGHLALWSACAGSWEQFGSEHGAVFGVEHGLAGGVGKDEVLRRIAGTAQWGSVKINHDPRGLLGLRKDIEALGGAEAVGKAMAEHSQVSDNADADEALDVARAFESMDFGAGARILLAALPEDANVLRTLGRVLRNLGELKEARAVLDRAMKAGAGSGLDRALTLHALGNVSEDEGNPKEAAEKYRAALALYKENGFEKTAGAAAVLHSLASTVDVSGNSADGEKLFIESLEVLREIGLGESRKAADTLVNLGDICSALGKEEEARGRYREAMAVTERTVGAMTVTWANAQFGLAVMDLQGGNMAEAKQGVSAALEIYEVLGVNNANKALIAGVAKSLE